MTPPSAGFRLVLDKDFLEDLRYWNGAQPKVAGKLLELVEVTRRDPFTGIGIPEPLKQLGAGLWSRRIAGEHRFVYRVEADCIHLLQGRYYYQALGCAMTGLYFVALVGSRRSIVFSLPFLVIPSQGDVHPLNRPHLH